MKKIQLLVLLILFLFVSTNVNAAQSASNYAITITNSNGVAHLYYEQSVRGGQWFLIDSNGNTRIADPDYVITHAKGTVTLKGERYVDSPFGVNTKKTKELLGDYIKNYPYLGKQITQYASNGNPLVYGLNPIDKKWYAVAPKEDGTLAYLAVASSDDSLMNTIKGIVTDGGSVNYAGKSCSNIHTSDCDFVYAGLNKKATSTNTFYVKIDTKVFQMKC